MQTWQEGVVLPVRLLYTHGHTTYFDWNVLAQVPMYASHVARTCPYFRLGGSAEPGRSPLNLYTATKQAAKQRIWTRISVSPIVVDGDSENRSPEADFGPPGIEN